MPTLNWLFFFSVLFLCPTMYKLEFNEDYPLQVLLKAEKQEME